MQQNHGDVKVAKRKFCDEFATELDGQNPPNKKFFYRNNAKFEEHGTVENLVCLSYISYISYLVWSAKLICMFICLFQNAQAVRPTPVLTPEVYAALMAQSAKERYQDPILPRDTSRRNTAGLAHSTYLVGQDNLEMIGYHKNLVIIESF